MRLRGFLLAFFLLISGFALAADPTGTNTTGGGNSTTEGNNTKQGNSVSNCTQGSSQNGFPAGTNTCTGAAVAYSGPGDIVSGATGWYSCSRAYNAAYATATGKLCNVTRASDSETCDILAATTGGPGLTANCSGSDNNETLAVFLASTTGTVTKAYDQSGNGKDATTATPPTLTLSCINTSIPCLTGTGTQFFASSAITTVAQPNTFSVVGLNTGTNSTIFSTDNATSLQRSGANNWIASAGTSQNLAVSDNAVHAVQVLFSGASSFGNVDGTETSISPNTVATGTPINIMSGSAGFSPWRGKFMEGGLWPSGFTGPNRTAMCKNQQAYYGAGNFGAAC